MISEAQAPTGRLLGRGEQRRPHEIEVRRVGYEGDVRMAWDRTVPAEVEAARAQFNEMRRKGYLTHKVTRRGQPGEQVSEFDPAAEEYLYVPPMSGG